MNLVRTSLALVAACGLLQSATSALAAGAKDYQYTGTITAMDDSSFTILKGTESSQFAKDADTKLPEGAKVGDKVTVHYVMHATTVDASAAPKEKAAAKEKAPAKEKAAKAGKKADAAAPATAAPSAKP